MKLLINTKPFSFKLTKSLKSSNALITKKTGWLLYLKDPYGRYGWGEVAPLNISELRACESIINSLGINLEKESIENDLPELPRSLAFGLGSSLAELDILNEKNNFYWPESPRSSFLLPTDTYPLESVIQYIKKSKNKRDSCTIKWKVSNQRNHINEKKILKEILAILPENYKLRIDPNGGWSKQEAQEWINELKDEPRLEWIEQPLPAQDIKGLLSLANQTPIALDESLVEFPYLRKSWKSWQIRRPALDGDPRLLLEELEQGGSHIVISTAFETGIGRRWINYLAAKQAQGQNPCAPGLAPGWCPKSQLFNNNPKSVWEAA